MLEWLFNNTIEVAYWFGLWNLLHFLTLKIKSSVFKKDKTNDEDT